MQSTRQSIRSHGALSRAFTLIELLVVIVIIVLLISILLPAIQKARAVSYMLKEMANANQIAVAYTTYTVENKESTFTGYIPWAVGHLNDQASPNVWLFPDPNNPRYMLEGNVIKVPGGRFAGATGYTWEGLQIDRAVYRDFIKRNQAYSDIFENRSPRTVMYDDNIGGFVPSFTYHTSIGLNYTYVGGNACTGAMPNFVRGGSTGGGSMGHPKNRHYVTKMYEVTRVDRLMLGSTARGVDVGTIGTGYTSQGNGYGTGHITWSNASRVIPGWWHVLPPKPEYYRGSRNDGTPQLPAVTWSTDNNFKTTTDPKTWGYVDARHGNKVVSVMMDGHVERFKLADLRDMTRWSNLADKPDWVYVP